LELMASWSQFIVRSAETIFLAKDD